MIRHILVASLGESPAVVTETIDAIERSENIEISEVVTVGTSDYNVNRGQELLAEHVYEHYSRRIKYLPLQVYSSHVDDETSNIEFFGLVAQQLRNYRKQPNTRTYVSIAGGRKTMSALMALAAQIYGAVGLYHIVVTDEANLEYDLEAKGQIERLARLPSGDRSRVLHPEPEEIRLVKLPIIGLFPLLNDLIDGLSGNETNQSIEALLLSSGLLEKQANGRIQVTASGTILREVLEDIESLPEPCALAPYEKTVQLHDHHGKRELQPLADKMRLFSFSSRINSTEFNSQFDRARAVRTSSGRLLIDKSEAFDEILLTLVDSQKGYRLSVRTTAKTTAQANRLMKALYTFLGVKAV